MDGSLNSNSYSTGTPEPAVLLPQSPESLFNMNFSETVPRGANIRQMEEDSQEEVHYNDVGVDGQVRHDSEDEESEDYFGEVERTQDMSQSYHLSVSTDLIGTPILTNCNKISAFLSENGYQSVKLLNSDIDRKTG